MALEIERKFRVIDNSFRKIAHKSLDVCQGYLSRDKNHVVRVRIIDNKAFITVKGINVGATRNEWEYPIPVDDAKQMLKICEGNIVSKTRYIVTYEGLKWEIDEFHGLNQGLTIAEVELPNEDFNLKLPPFVGKEVTGDPQYYNSNL